MISSASDRPANSQLQPSGNGVARRPRRSKPKEEEGRVITPIALLHALRRRWLPAVLLAIPAAVIAVVAVWKLIPAPYESYAIVKVSQYQPKLINKQSGGYESNFLNYRDSQMAYMKSRPVLEAALRKPEVAATETISVVKYPMEFLSRRM